MTTGKVDFATFYAKNKGLAFKVARKVHARMLAMGDSTEFDDVFQEASLIMMRAYEKFDPSMGFQFSSYYVRAAYYDLNKLVNRQAQHLCEMTMNPVVGDEDESMDLESVLDGGHGTPEQYLETKQILQQIEERLSPMAQTIVAAMIDPPEQMSREWEQVRQMGARMSIEPSASFVCDYMRKVTGLPHTDLKNAVQEIKMLSKELHEQR